MDAAYEARRASPISAIVEDMLMIEPPCAATITGRTALATRNTPRTFTAMTRSHSSSEVSSTVPTPAIPALLNRTSMVPNASITDVTSAVHDAFVGHVDGERRRRPAARGGVYVDATIATVSSADSRDHVGHGDGRTLPREQDRRRAADAGARAGDEAHLAGQTPGHAQASLMVTATGISVAGFARVDGVPGEETPGTPRMSTATRTRPRGPQAR